jgi:hypothetical protein
MYSGGAYDTFLPRLLAFTPFTTSDAAGCESNVALDGYDSGDFDVWK